MLSIRLDSGDGKKRIIIDDMKMKMDEDAIHVALENTMLSITKIHIMLYITLSNFNFNS
jgi:hypothetical protein